jgi:hypothetical protein
MIVLGILLLVWGIAILALAKPLHANWGQMIGRLRGAGYGRPPFGTRFLASPEGLRTMRVVGVGGIAAGAVLAVVALLRRGP